jgi:hypothetical protein
VEFRLVARLAVLRVVAVLLAPAGVARRGLDVAIGFGTDPYFGPCRRNGERVEPFPDLGARDALAIRQVISPAVAGALARNAVRAVCDVTQPGMRRRVAMVFKAALMRI